MKFSTNFVKAGDELCALNNKVPAPYIRKTFSIDFVPEKAEITICGLGFYELYINGENITKGPLAPYISNPNHICYYDNYDISQKLKKGKNIIGVLLGNGMRNAFGGFVWDFEKASFRGTPIVALCLEAEGEGKKTEFEADETFKTHPSPITYNDMRMGYCYNARLEVPRWNEVDFAEGYYDSPFGRLKCDWKKDGDKIEMKIFVPAGMRGRLVPDDGFKSSEKIPESLVGGEYTISLEYLK